MLTWLFWLVPVIAIAGIVWYARRKMAERKAIHAERFKEFFEKSAAPGDAARLAPPRAVPVSAATPAARTPASAPPASGAIRERLLTPPQTVLYYLLKSALSDHEVLAQVSVATLLDASVGAAGLEAEARQRRLAAAVADFVVCDKSFKAVAVVQCSAREGGAADAAAFAAASARSAGLRWVEVAPHALPKRESIRSLVLGAE